MIYQRFNPVFVAYSTAVFDSLGQRFGWFDGLPIIRAQDRFFVGGSKNVRWNLLFVSEGLVVCRCDARVVYFWHFSQESALEETLADILTTWMVLLVPLSEVLADPTSALLSRRVSAAFSDFVIFLMII